MRPIAGLFQRTNNIVVDGPALGGRWKEDEVMSVQVGPLCLMTVTTFLPSTQNSTLQDLG